MKIQEIKNHLSQLETIAFQLPSGELVPSHFHVTEVGKITKHFIDCGGKERTEIVANFQLWNADDYDHRLNPGKLVSIIDTSEKVLGSLNDLDIEVEYQGATIGKYGLDFDGTNFVLVSKATDCLARTDCGVPEVKSKMVEIANSSCNPNGGCC